mgnify:CR=1 FL=1
MAVVHREAAHGIREDMEEAALVVITLMVVAVAHQV